MRYILFFALIFTVSCASGSRKGPKKKDTGMATPKNTPKPVDSGKSLAKTKEERLEELKSIEAKRSLTDGEKKEREVLKDKNSTLRQGRLERKILGKNIEDVEVKELSYLRQRDKSGNSMDTKEARTLAEMDEGILSKEEGRKRLEQIRATNKLRDSGNSESEHKHGESEDEDEVTAEDFGI